MQRKLLYWIPDALVGNSSSTNERRTHSYGLNGSRWFLQGADWASEHGLPAQSLRASSRWKIDSNISLIIWWLATMWWVCERCWYRFDCNGCVLSDFYWFVDIRWEDQALILSSSWDSIQSRQKFRSHWQVKILANKKPHQNLLRQHQSSQRNIFWSQIKQRNLGAAGC